MGYTCFLDSSVPAGSKSVLDTLLQILAGQGQKIDYEFTLPLPPTRSLCVLSFRIARSSDCLPM